MKDSPHLDLPPDMLGWTVNNAGVMHHIHTALRDADVPLTEGQLWNLIARTYSPVWAKANARLQHAQQDINIHKSHENRALGAIGMALDSESINQELSAHSTALADFTIVDEELRGDRNLRQLLEVLVSHSRKLEESMEISRAAAGITAAFSEVAPVPEKVEVTYGSPLQKAFGFVGRALKRKAPRRAQNESAPPKRGR